MCSRDSWYFEVSHEQCLQSDLSERGLFLEHMTRDKENLARAEEEVQELKEKITSLQEELQKANAKLNVFDKVKSTTGLT